MEDFNRFNKKRPVQHRIEEGSVDLFKASLPHDEKFDITADEQSKNDYGIDLDLQFFKDENHTGRVGKVQLKGTGSPKYSKNKKYLKFSLDIGSLYFFIYKVKVPIALVVTDNLNGRVFWFPVQTDALLLKRFEERQLNPDLDKNDTITISIPVSNILKPSDCISFYDYFVASSLFLAKKVINETAKESGDLRKGGDLLKEFEDNLYGGGGYEYLIKHPSDPVTKGSVFSINITGEKRIDYYIKPGFDLKNLPQLKLKTRFNLGLNEHKELSEKLLNMVSNGAEEKITLTNETIEEIRFTTGIKNIDDLPLGDGKFKLTIGPSRRYIREVTHINISNGIEDMQNSIDMWREGKTLGFKSQSGQPVSFESTAVKDGQISLEIKVDMEQLDSLEQELRVMRFFTDAKEIRGSLVDKSGLKTDFFGGKFDGNMLVSKRRYELINALVDLEKVAGIKFDYPLKSDISSKEVVDVLNLRDVLVKHIRPDRSSVKLEFLSKKYKPAEVLKNGEWISIGQRNGSISILGKEYLLSDRYILTKGKIDSAKNIKGNEYDIKLSEVFMEMTSNNNFPVLTT